MVRDYVIEAHVYALVDHLPVYRLWVDGELMCERTYWIDANTHFIKEQIIVELEDSLPHTLELERVTGTLWIGMVSIIDVEHGRTIQEHILGETNTLTFRLS